MVRVVAIIQARLGSTRLPGKVLLDIAGQPMLVRVVERTRRAKSLADTLVATTIDPGDQQVYELCATRGYPVFRGSPTDLLDRYYQAALAHQAEAVVRITADCPLIDPDVIDHVVGHFLKTGVDFAANRLPPPWKRTYPIGLDVEVCTFGALEQAWQAADQAYQREHVMPYLYEQEGRFRIALLDYPQDYGHLRWAVDTTDDLELVRRIFEHFDGEDGFTWLQVVDLFKNQPELATINAHVHHKHFQESEEIPPKQTNA